MKRGWMVAFGCAVLMLASAGSIWAHTIQDGCQGTCDCDFASTDCTARPSHPRPECRPGHQVTGATACCGDTLGCLLSGCFGLSCAFESTCVPDLTDAQCTCGDGDLDPGEQCDWKTPGSTCCDGGSCQFLDSSWQCTNDGNPCTDDVCNGAGACVHTNNSATCNDGSSCTQDDRCQNGSCAGTPLVCPDDGNPCTSGVCVPLEPFPACDHRPVLCLFDGNPCTRDFCDPATGQCNTPEPPTTSCDDGSGCTDFDFCSNGSCTGVPRCDDNDPCTVDICVSSVTPCEHRPVECPVGEVCVNGACAIGTCGDGIRNSAIEECDDGNTTGGDGCSSTCRVEACPNGRVDVGEECDDGNTVNGDGCSAACVFECTFTGEWSTPVANVGFVSHIREDAGGVLTGVGWTRGHTADAVVSLSGTRTGANVSVTVGYATPTTWSGRINDCNTATFDQRVVAGEVFQGLNLVSHRLRDTYCGNGPPPNSPEVPFGEGCDDGNWLNGDPCTAMCTLPTCGNGIPEPNEQCDDGNTQNCDACTNGCTTRACGNGVLEACEECDGGPNCAPDCTIQICGNGEVEYGEECDDGDLDDADGCDRLCRLEGCSFTGAWRGRAGVRVWNPNNCAPGGQNCLDQTIWTGTVVLHARENANGSIDGSYSIDGKSASSVRISGQRDRARLSLTIGTTTYTGLILDCDQSVSLGTEITQQSGLNGQGGVFVTRERSTFCGDGLFEPTYEACEDGNFDSGDTCSAACTLGSGCGSGVTDANEECDDGNASNNDACAACRNARCGDGYLRRNVESCDDANTTPNDGCDACTLLPESAPSGSLTDPLGVTTDTESDGATPSDPVETTVTHACAVTGDTATIAEGSAPPSGPSWSVVTGTTVTITRTGDPSSVTRSCPLYLTFRIDPSLILAGQDITKIDVLRNGQPVPNCTGLGVPEPDLSCVDSRTRAGQGTGDVIIIVRTVSASDWTFGGDVCGDVPAIGCLPTLPGGAKLRLVGGAEPRLKWTWKGAPEVVVDLFGNPLATNDLTLCAYDANGRILSLTAPAAGTCGDKPCWKSSASGEGFTYGDAALDPHGVAKLVLKAGIAGKSRLKLKAKGPALQAADLPLSTPVHVQLRSEEGACFEAVFSQPTVSDAAGFKAVSDQ